MARKLSKKIPMFSKEIESLGIRFIRSAPPLATYGNQDPENRNARDDSRATSSI